MACALLVFCSVDLILLSVATVFFPRFWSTREEAKNAIAGGGSVKDYFCALYAMSYTALVYCVQQPAVCHPMMFPLSAQSSVNISS